MLVYGRNQHNIVEQLSSNEKQIFKNVNTQKEKEKEKKFPNSIILKAEFLNRKKKICLFFFIRFLK